MAELMGEAVVAVIVLFVGGQQTMTVDWTLCQYDIYGTPIFD